MMSEDKIANFVDNLTEIEDLGTSDSVQDYDSYNVDTFGESNVNDVFSEYCFGASKIVFIAPEVDWVIKIPFFGFIASDEEYDEEYDTYEVVGEHWEDYRCADSKYGNDYCEAEVRKYQKAKEAEFADFLAETKLYGYAKEGHPIYIQKKSDYKAQSTPSKKWKSYFKDNRTDRISNDEDWNARAAEWYGIDKIKAFIDWCEKNDTDILSDLHSDNVGYTKEGRPVIFDYSGFNDCDNM